MVRSQRVSRESGCTSSGVSGFHTVRGVHGMCIERSIPVFTLHVGSLKVCRILGWFSSKLLNLWDWKKFWRAVNEIATATEVGFWRGLRMVALLSGGMPRPDVDCARSIKLERTSTSASE